jgi:hypothetical protein
MHIRAPGEVRAGVLVVVSHHLVMPRDVANGVPYRRALEVVLYADTMLRTQVRLALEAGPPFLSGTRRGGAGS